MKTETTAEKPSCAANSACTAPVTEVSAKPKYSVDHHDDFWSLNIEVPGAKHDSVEVGFEDGILDIKARRSDSIPESWRPLDFVPELRNYRLRLEVPESIDSEQISAKLEDGVLRLQLPLSDAVKPRSITVE